MRHLVKLAAVLVAATLAWPGSAGAATGRTFGGTYMTAAGTRSYSGYLPSNYAAGRPLPLVVVLHGCTQSADVMRQLTRFDQLAEAKGFIVVFPEQSAGANPQRCWNFFQRGEIQRGAGEASLIAGITKQVKQQYAVNPRRVYVAGLSAGGAMASVMGATYPDLYAAIGVGSGCEYAAGAACAGSRSADPEQAAKAAYAAMGARARPIPVIAFQGDQDTTVPPVNADQLVSQWQLTNDLADNGSRDGSVSRTTLRSVTGRVPGGRSYTIRYYGDEHSNELVEYWLIHGMAHAWSGGCGCQAYADPSGPDETAAMYAFFSAHKLP